MNNKTILFAIEGTANQTNAWKNALYYALEKISEKISLFDPAKETLTENAEQTTNNFFNTLQTEKPDFLVFVPARDSTGFFTLEIIKKINENSPKTKTIALLGDDDTHFECFSRYVMLFIDYALIIQYNYAKAYQKEGLGQKIYPTNISNNELFKPLDCQKIYDVTFIGRPTKERINSIRFLIKNNINLKIFGQNWTDYPEFANFYNGALSNEEMVKIINQTKINLSFSRNDFGELHYKGRIFEVAESKAFQLVEYFPEYLNIFKNEKEISFFKNDEELLSKIKYYLKNEKEREQIATLAHEKIVKEYNLNTKLKEFFKKINKEDKNFKREPYNTQKNIIMLPKKILKETDEQIKQKTANTKYITFYDENDKNFEYKNKVQIKAIEKTKKPISCCGYYIYSNSLGDYLLRRSNLDHLNETETNQILDLTQITTTTDYFLKNLELFKQFYHNKNINLINKENTAFIDLPLYRTTKIKKTTKYKTLSKAFKGGCLFLTPLYTSLKEGKIFFNKYPYQIIINPIINGNTFILKHIINSIFDKRYWNRIIGNKQNFAETK